MAKNKYERIPVEVNLDHILRSWGKEFTHQEGEIVSVEHYVDVTKGKVCFIVTVEKKEASDGTA